jgi:hypothetical protein
MATPSHGSASVGMTATGRLTFTGWLVCAIAAIGFAFDIYELLMLPLVIKPALATLGGLTAEGTPLLVPGSPEYTKWARALFFLPALAGGVFGLLGGYLTDLLGRRRVLTFSILLYAFAALAAGFATSLPQLLFFRCLVFIGVCVEFVAAVAWLAELFPDREQRERVLGWTQAFSSLGGLLVGSATVLASASSSARRSSARPCSPRSSSPRVMGSRSARSSSCRRFSVVRRGMQQSCEPRRRRRTRRLRRRSRQASPRRRPAASRPSRAMPPTKRWPPSRSTKRSAASWAAYS